MEDGSSLPCRGAGPTDSGTMSGPREGDKDLLMIAGECRMTLGDRIDGLVGDALSMAAEDISFRMVWLGVGFGLHGDLLDFVAKVFPSADATERCSAEPIVGGGQSQGDLMVSGDTGGTTEGICKGGGPTRFSRFIDVVVVSFRVGSGDKEEDSPVTAGLLLPSPDETCGGGEHETVTSLVSGGLVDSGRVGVGGRELDGVLSSAAPCCGLTTPSGSSHNVSVLSEGALQRDPSATSAGSEESGVNDDTEAAMLDCDEAADLSEDGTVKHSRDCVMGRT